MNSIFNKFKQLSTIGQLIAINLTVWLSLQLSRLLFWLVGLYFPWEESLALDVRFSHLIFKPWTLFTYMWTHANFMDNTFHIIFNMLWLYWFGKFFLQIYSKRQLVNVYILGGIFAGLFYMVTFNFVPGFATLTAASGGGYLIGASGAIFALVTAVATRQPDVPIYLNFIVRVVPLKLKWFALIALGLNLMNLLGGHNTGGIVCHLGGMLFGFLFALFERRGVDISNVVTTVFNKVRQWVTPKRKAPKMKATPGGTHHVNADRQKDMDFNQHKQERQQRIDDILDKISRSGYNGLTAEEKAFLFDASQRAKK